MKRLLAAIAVAGMSIALFAGCGSPANTQPAPAATAAEANPAADSSESAEANNTYKVIVRDADNGSAVAGAKVQLCSDTQCLMADTDADGTAVFNQEPGNYTAHLLTAPQGYEGSEEALKLTADEHTVTYEIHRATLSEDTSAEPEANESIAEAGIKISFEAKDLNGNTVKSEDLFKDHKVTMINFWGTNCEPCKQELAGLEEYNKKLADMDCQVIGICVDTLNNEEKVALANELLKEHGVTYTNIAITEEIAYGIPINATPTTYFVGSDGTLLTWPVEGADFGAYDEKIQEALEAIG